MSVLTGAGSQSDLSVVTNLLHLCIWPLLSTYNKRNRIVSECLRKVNASRTHEHTYRCYLYALEISIFHCSLHSGVGMYNARLDNVSIVLLHALL